MMSLRLSDEMRVAIEEEKEVKSSIESKAIVKI